MFNIPGATADAVWRKALAKIQRQGKRQPGRDQETRELLHASFTIKDPRQRLVYSLPLNPAFLIADAIWMISGRNDLEFLRFWNPRMSRWSDDKHAFHGAYGDRLIRHFGGINQLERALEALEANPQSRQVVLQIWDAQSDLPDPAVRSLDVPCNLNSHLMIRDGRLEWLQIMRSNDVVWGTPTNFFQFTTLQEIMAGWLGIQVGTYNHVSDSLHIYRRHWELLDEDISQAVEAPTNRTDLRLSYARWREVWPRLEEATNRLATSQSTPATLGVLDEYEDLPEGYFDWLVVLAAEALRRRGDHDQGMELIRQASESWQSSWITWAKSKEESQARLTPPRTLTVQSHLEALTEDPAN